MLDLPTVTLAVLPFIGSVYVAIMLTCAAVAKKESSTGGTEMGKV